jgi:hypothetical protein
MEDKEAQAPRWPESQAFQTPDWEVPSSKPPRGKLFGWVGGYKTSKSGGRSTSDPLPPPPPPKDNSAFAKETLILPTREPSFDNGSVQRSSARLGTLAALRARFDALLPPTRKYPWGLNRRHFLLFVVMPALILLLFIFPLALGLGLRNRRSAAEYLPLPTDGGGIVTGELTFYSPGLGACGWEHRDGDAICAVSHLVWDAVQVGSNPNNNPLCGRKIRVRREVEGVGTRTVDVTVVDRCTGCKANDIDLSPGVFNQLAREEQGRVTGSWAWL